VFKLKKVQATLALTPVLHAIEAANEFGWSTPSSSATVTHVLLLSASAWLFACCVRRSNMQTPRNIEAYDCKQLI
jgi:protein-S-isoprenylcysteine O-methyltransferase Ste14